VTDAPADLPSDAATPLKAPDPAVRLVYGTAAIGDLDEFLADCDAVAAETGAVVQAFDAGLVASVAHLREAARLAARSIARGEAIARDPGVEMLLYAPAADRSTPPLSSGSKRAIAESLFSSRTSAMSPVPVDRAQTSTEPSK